MNTLNHLDHHLIVASPCLSDDYFSRGVIYIIRHDTLGSMGILINKPLPIPLSSLLSHLDINSDNQRFEEIDVLEGGPVAPEQGFVIYESNSNDNEITLTSSKQILDELTHVPDDTKFLVTLGHAGWAQGQLEEELKKNDWLLVPFSKDLMFDVPMEQRWEKAAKSIGVDILNFSGQSGHA